MLVGIFFVISSASASPILNKLESTGGYVNITEANGTIICNANGTMTNDGTAFTQITDMGSANYQGGWGVTGNNSKVSYFPNPTVSAHQLVSSGGSYQCYFATGLDNDNLVINSEVHNGYGTYNWNQGQNANYANAISGNLVINIFNTLHTVPDVADYSNYDNFTQYQSYWGQTWYYDWSSQIATSSITNFTYTDGFSDSYNAVPSYGFIELQAKSGGDSGDIQIFDMSTLENTYLWFSDIFQYCYVNQTCSLNYQYDIDLFKPDDYYKLYYYASSTASAVNLGIHQIASRSDLGIYGSGSIIASSTATSTAFSYYELVPYSSSLEKFMGTTTVAVWFKPLASTTDIINSINNPSSPPEMDQVVLQLIQAYCDPTDSDLACMAKITPLYAGQKVANISTIAMNFVWKKLQNMFPFNFIGLVNQTWIISATTPIPDDLVWLIPTDSHGEININFKMLPQAPTSTITIWSPSFFENEAFAKIKGASKYLWYALTLLVIYIYGKILYKEIIGDSSNNNQ